MPMTRRHKRRLKRAPSFGPARAQALGHCRVPICLPRLRAAPILQTRGQSDAVGNSRNSVAAAVIGYRWPRRASLCGSGGARSSATRPWTCAGFPLDGDELARRQPGGNKAAVWTGPVVRDAVCRSHASVTTASWRSPRTSWRAVAALAVETAASRLVEGRTTGAATSAR